jgi:RimJ/RimL family protein N-acetyltransferase
LIKERLCLIHLEQLPDLQIQTERLILEPVTENHAQELWELFRDPELHRFVPFESPTLEQQRERCARWAKRKSPDGKEIWLNWVGRDRATNIVAAHFQAGVKEDQVASIGYLVARSHQKRGYAFEGLNAVFAFLHDRLNVREVKAWADTRNEASHRLAKKLGMV